MATGKQIDKYLKQRLRDHGLDPEIWGKEFVKTGITNSIQLKYADQTAKDELLKVKTHGWEEKALNACFEDKIDEKNEAKKNQLVEIIENTEKRLEKLNDIIDETDRRNRIAFSFDDATSHKDVHKGLITWNNRVSELSKRESITSLDLVKQISSGRILRGTLLQKDMIECVKPRRKLVHIHQKDVELMLPPKTEKYETMEFFDQNQSKAFDHVIEHWGVKAAVGAGIGFGIFSIGIGYAHGETSETKKQNSSLSAFTEVKDMVVVSTATFSLIDVKHSISDEAMDELRKIEAYQDKDRKNGLKSFLREFGSHYYTGTFTFGGIFNRSVECRSREKMSQSHTLNLVKNGLQLSISGMYEEFVGSAAISGEMSKDEHHTEFKKDEDYKVAKKLTLIGGPPEVDHISLWKFGLVESNKTWAVIDKDNFRSKWRGVWDLVTEDLKGHFKDIDSVRSDLKTAWDEIKMNNEILVVD